MIDDHGTDTPWEAISGPLVGPYWRDLAEARPTRHGRLTHRMAGCGHWINARVDDAGVPLARRWCWRCKSLATRSSRATAAA